MNISKSVAFDNIITQTTAGATDLEGEKVVDVSGYEGVAFIGIMDTVTAAGELQMYAQYSNSSSTTDMVDDTGTAVGSSAATATTDYTDKILVCDVYKPLKRYWSAHVDKATQNSEIRVIALRYGKHKGPVVQSTEQFGVLDAEVFVSPTT